MGTSETAFIPFYFRLRQFYREEVHRDFEWNFPEEQIAKINFPSAFSRL